MQAYRRFNTFVAHLMNVSGAEGPQRSGHQFSSPRDDPRQSVANFGMPLGEYAAERDEGARAAAMVSPVGALTGQPGEQPRFEFRIAGKADVVAIHGIVGHQWLP